MRNKSVRYVISVAVLSMVAGCSSMTPQQQHYTEAGAAGGALIGGGLGCGVAAINNVHSAEGYEIGCPTGVGMGALIGGTIGYLMAPKAVPAPPPPRPASAASATSATASATASQTEVGLARSTFRL